MRAKTITQLSKLSFLAAAAWSFVAVQSGCGGEQGSIDDQTGETRSELQNLGGKADIPDWLKPVSTVLSCTKSAQGKFKGLDSAHLYQFSFEKGKTYKFDFKANYSPLHGAAIGVYETELGERLASATKRIGNQVALAHTAKKSQKVLVAVYSMTWFATGNYTLSVGCTGSSTSCKSNADCGAKQFCAFSKGCGGDGLPGTCTARPEVCTMIYAPVCGCDGKTHGSACSAASAGVSVMQPGECGLAIVTDKLKYKANESGTATLDNITNDSIFLGGCSAMSVQKQTAGGGWGIAEPGKVCFWEGYAVEVKAGQTYSETFQKEPGTYRFVAGYGVGCEPGKPMSKANCQSFGTAYSKPFTVGAATACNYNNLKKNYISKDPAQCAAMMFMCVENFIPFFDDCGCGCQLVQTL